MIADSVERLVNRLTATVLVSAAVALTAAQPAPDFAREPLWAYGFETAPKPGDTAQPQTPPNRDLRPNEDANEQTTPRRVEASGATYSLVDVRDGSHVIDWFPGDHPPMPTVAERGPAASGRLTRGCASCHLPNGKGRPENAPVAGLTPAYFLQQLKDLRDGLRHTADPRKPNTPTMINLAKDMTVDEMMAAAGYFSAIPYATPWIRVVETDTVPKTRIVGNLFIPIEQARSESIAGRIIEVPENEEQSELLRNPRSGFIAYVPVGAVAKGKTIATTVSRASACVTCHGADLLGIENIPPIAGRSASYIVRQMWDIQQGTRYGAFVPAMKTAIADLTPQDLVNVAAYVASRSPKK